MKKITILLLTGLMAFSLAACSATPSDEKIKTALEDGTITVEDAKAKGWIDDAWIKANFEKVEANSKIHLFEPFETTNLDGTPASSAVINGKMCLVFFDTMQEKTMEKLAAFNEACEAMKEKGVPVLGIITDSDWQAAQEKLKDMKFPIIVYNDEMKASLDSYGEMIDNDLVAVFTKDGGLYTAWQTEATADSLLESAQSLADED